MSVTNSIEQGRDIRHKWRNGFESSVRLSSLRRPDGRRGLQTVGPRRVREGRQLAPVRGQHRQQLRESPANVHTCYRSQISQWE